MQNRERSKNSTITNLIIIKSLPGDSQGPLVLLRSIAALIYKRASAVIEMYVCMYVCFAYVHTAHKPIHRPILLQSLSRLNQIAANRDQKSALSLS